MSKVRPATDAEMSQIVTNDSLDCYCAVLEEGGEIKGHIALSFALGEVFGHDTRCWSEDPRDATKLWLHARTFLRKMGYKAVNIHIEPNDEDLEMMKFWKKLGFEPKALVMRGEI